MNSCVNIFHQLLRLNALLLALLFCSGCGYGEVSPRAYEISKALYSICNRKQAGKLEQVSTLIKDSQSEGEISGQEAGWLNDIVDEAKSERWEEATVASRQIMEDQINR